MDASNNTFNKDRLVATEYAISLIKTAVELGADAESLCDGVVNKADLETLESIPYTDFGMLLLRCLDQVNDPKLSFLYGSALRVETHGFMGYASKSAGNLRQAIEINHRYWATRLPFLSFDIQETQEKFSIIVEIPSQLKALERFIMESLIVSGQTTIRQMLPIARFDLKVELNYEAPVYTNLYAEYIEGEIQFKQARNRIVGRLEDLNVDVPTADPALYKLAKTECQRRYDQLVFSEKISKNVTEFLRDKIKLNFDTQKPSWDKQLPGLEDVSENFNLSPRQLRRKLAEENANFKQLLLDVKMEIACLYLADSKLTIQQLAYNLGYSEASNFTLAFKKYFNQPPKQYRQKITG